MKEVNELYNLMDLLRGYASMDKTVLNVGTIFAVVKGNRQEIPKIVQEPNLVQAMLSLIDSLNIEDEFKTYMYTEFENLFLKVPTDTLVKVLLMASQIGSSAYDYMVENASSSGGIKDNLFSTPAPINEVAATYLLNGLEGNVTFYDGSAGIGNSAIHFARKATHAELNLQEISLNTATILKIRLFLQDIEAKVAVGDSIREPAFVAEGRANQYDRVFMAPPFGIRFTEEQQSVFKNDKFNRFVYGIPPRSQGDLAFLSCGLSATKPNGKAAFLLPLGALFRGGPELEIRKRLNDLDVIEVIIELPALLQYTGIKTALVLCNKNKSNDRKNKILMINAEPFATNINRKEITIESDNITKINDMIFLNQEMENICSIIRAEDIDASNMLPSRYVHQDVTFMSEFGEVEMDLEALSGLDTKPLSSFIDIYRGYNAPSKDEEKDGEFAVLKISDIQQGEVNLEGLSRYTIKKNVKVDNHRVRKGDLLLSIRGANRKSAVFTDEREDVLLSANFAGIRCNPLMDSNFLQLYFESPVAQVYFEKYTEGSTVLTLSTKALKDMPVPDLPIETQRQIVDKYRTLQVQLQAEIEKLESQLQEAKLQVYKTMGIDKAFTIL